MLDLFDNPEEIGASDPDELKPTVKVIPFPKMSFDERLSYDDHSLAVQMRYQGVAA